MLAKYFRFLSQTNSALKITSAICDFLCTKFGENRLKIEGARDYWLQTSVRSERSSLPDTTTQAYLHITYVRTVGHEVILSKVQYHCIWIGQTEKLVRLPLLLFDELISCTIFAECSWRPGARLV